MSRLPSGGTTSFFNWASPTVVGGKIYQVVGRYERPGVCWSFAAACGVFGRGRTVRPSGTGALGVERGGQAEVGGGL